MALVIGTMFTSCEKDDGSEGIQMRMRNRDNGNDRIYLLSVDDTINYSGNWVCLGISSSNNFYVVEEHTYNASYSYCDIACVGGVSSLGKINNIPNSGWTDEIAVQPGQGYIIRHWDSKKKSRYFKYARVYVEEWIEGTSGGILGAVIRYEDNWKEE